MAALSTAFSFGMELYIIEDYKNIELGTVGADMETAGSVPTEEGSGRTSPGSRLTNALVKELLISNSHVSEEEWKRNRMRILRQPGGKPVLEHALRALSDCSCVEEIVLVTREEILDILIWGKELSGSYDITKLLADFLVLEKAAYTMV